MPDYGDNIRILTSEIHMNIRRTCPDLRSFWYSPAMNIQHFEKGLHYSADELLNLARKLGKLATFCKKVKDEDSFIRVEAERRPTKKRRDEVKATVTVSLPRMSLRSESRRPQVIEAVDRCIEKLEVQLKRYKEEQTGREQAHVARRRKSFS